MKASQMASGLAISGMQIVAMLGLMSARWSKPFQTTSSALQIFVLDLDAWNLSCLVGGTSTASYISSALLCPMVLVWLALCHSLSQLKCIQSFGVRRWKLPYTINTIGLGLQLGFGTLTAVALKPMMCYRHPNGRFSILNYPSIFCGESGHEVVLVIGIGVLMVALSFLAACSYAVLKVPTWSLNHKYWNVQSFRFGTSNFRLDSYHFIVPLLCRSLGFTIAIVVGTNVPPIQTALVSTVLVIYVVLQAWFRPWKVRAINIADTILSSSFLILNGTSIQDDLEMQSNFAEYFTVVILVFRSFKSLWFCISFLEL
eukprot:Skav202728  [mRNA]  locus=scaffold1326:138438:139379:- [translate_table: standard]